MTETITAMTARDGVVLRMRSWRPADPRGRVVFIHGVISHGGWYGASCRRLAAAGFEVDFLDRRGSGLNRQSRGDVDDWQTWITDVTDHLATIGEPPDRTTTVLIGISWGGKLAVQIAKRHPELIDALGLVCPGLFARQFPSPSKYAVLSLLRRVGRGGWRVPIPLRDPALFTDVPDWQAFIADDPLTLRHVTVRFALADRELTKSSRRDPELIRVPTWLVTAGRDRIIQNEPTLDFVRRISHPDKRLIEYPNAAHTFEFEPDPEPYFADLVDWVRHVTASPGAEGGV